MPVIIVATVTPLPGHRDEVEAVPAGDPAKGAL